MDTHRKSDGRSVTYAELAELLGVSRMTVAHWVAGDSRPNQVEQLIIEQLTGISSGYWLTEEDGMRLAAARREIMRIRNARPMPEASAVEKLAGRI